MNKYIIEVGVRVTNAVLIETFEVTAASEEEAMEFIDEGDVDAVMVASYVADEGDTMSEEVLSCYKKKIRKRISKTMSH